jgi:hypothetical protein
MKERKQKEKMTHSGLGGSDLGVGGLLDVGEDRVLSFLETVFRAKR